MDQHGWCGPSFGHEGVHRSGRCWWGSALVQNGPQIGSYATLHICIYAHYTSCVWDSSMFGIVRQQESLPPAGHMDHRSAKRLEQAKTIFLVGPYSANRPQTQADPIDPHLNHYLAPRCASHSTVPSFIQAAALGFRVSLSST